MAKLAGVLVTRRCRSDNLEDQIGLGPWCEARSALARKEGAASFRGARRVRVTPGTRRGVIAVPPRAAAPVAAAHVWFTVTRNTADWTRSHAQSENNTSREVGSFAMAPADSVFGLSPVYLPAVVGTVVLWLTAGWPLLRRVWQRLSVVSTHERVVVQGTVAEIFDYLADFSNAQEWDPNTKTAERDQVGPLRPGCSFSLVTLWKGSESPMKYTIGVIDPMEGRLVLKGDAPLVTALDTISVAPASGGSARETVVD